MSVYSKRISKIQEKIKDNSFLITNDKNIYYFTGLWDSNGYLLITPKNAYLFVDFRYGEVAEKIVTSANVIVFNNFYDSLNSIANENNISNCHIEATHVTLEEYKKYSQIFNFNLLDDKTLDNLIEEMRIIKDEEEYLLMKKAQDITEKAYYNVLPLLKAGVTEREISVELEHQIKILGAEDISFDLITITGKKTSLPHGVPSENKINNGDFFTFDIGSTYKGYHSDMTRTVSIGEPTSEMKEIYSIVLEAHNRALSAVSPGVKCSEIDKIARDYIEEKGYKDCFGHGTGHGVGLDIHESPSVSPKGDVTLREGMVITIEPGIYLRDKFGVRIEDMVIVTSTGCKSFATIPKELTII